MRNTKTNEYQAPDVLTIGAAHETIRQEKNFPSIDGILMWPLWFRTDVWVYCDCESPD